MKILPKFRSKERFKTPNMVTDLMQNSNVVFNTKRLSEEERSDKVVPIKSDISFKIQTKIGDNTMNIQPASGIMTGKQSNRDDVKIAEMSNDNNLSTILGRTHTVI